MHTWTFIPAADETADPEYQLEGSNMSAQVCFDSGNGKTYYCIVECAPDDTPPEDFWIRDCGEFNSLAAAKSHVERGIDAHGDLYN